MEQRWPLKTVEMLTSTKNTDFSPFPKILDLNLVRQDSFLTTIKFTPTALSYFELARNINKI